MLKVITASGEDIPLVDSSSFLGTTTGGYSNFLLQQVVESRMERHQIIETFGASYVFFFGESPRFLDCASIILNTHDFNWRAEWWTNYNTYLRGTRLVEMGARCYLFYDDNIIEGYIVQASATEQAGMPYHINLNFRFFVTNCSNLSMEGNIGEFPIRSSVVLPDGVELGSGDAWRRIINAYRGEAASALAGREASRRMAEAARTKAESEKTGLFGLPAPTKLGAPTRQSLTSIIREAGPTFSADPSVLAGLGAGPGILVDPANPANPMMSIPRDGKPLRGYIAENYDEYTGLGYALTYASFAPGANRPPLFMQSHLTRDLQESDDAFRQAIEALTCFGANINGPEPLISLGLGPNFLRGGKLDAASFRAMALDPTGYSTAKELLYEPLKGQYERTQDWWNSGRAAEQFDRSQRRFEEGASRFGDAILRAHDPLGVVYGGRQPQEENLVTNSRYTEGAGDPLYGYPSDFAEGPGYGQTGFGNFGGISFGSGSSTGDPGFKDPNKFTFAGVADERDAFDRFLLPQDDGTSLSGRNRDRRGFNSGGASFEIGGEMSAFSLISVDGILTPEGDARSQVDAIRERQEAQKFGFSVDNPFGVQCPTPPGTVSFSDSTGTDSSYSDGFSHSFP